jgi:hypothetical protein
MPWTLMEVGCGGYLGNVFVIAANYICFETIEVIDGSSRSSAVMLSVRRPT